MQRMEQLTLSVSEQTQVWQPRYRFPGLENPWVVDRRLCDPGFRSGVP